MQATMGARYGRGSDQTAGPSHASGRPTAEAVEDCPRVVDHQRSLQNFSSVAAEMGSVGVSDIPSVDLAQFKDPSPAAYGLTSSNNWSCLGIRDDPVAAKDVAASKPVSNATDVEIWRKVHAASGTVTAQSSRLATAAAKAVVPDECLASDKTGRRKFFSSLQGRTCSVEVGKQPR